MGSKFLISINPGDSLSIYRQIVEQIKAAIVNGLIVPGEKLPTHRDLAKELVIAPLTVKKAYDTLEQDGLIFSARGRGTFVAERQRSLNPETQQELKNRAQSFVLQAQILGLSEEEAIAITRKTWRETRKEK